MCPILVYESLKLLVDRWVTRCRLSLYNLLGFLPETKIRLKLQGWFYEHYKLYGLILMIILVLYDIIFNEGNLTKVFYVMPLVFLYYLLCKYEEVLNLYTFDQEECISSYLYHEILDSAEPGFIAFSTNRVISLEDFENIIKKISLIHNIRQY